MDYHQRTGDDNYSTLTLNQSVHSLSLTSSTSSILNSTSKTTSLMMSKQSNINVNRLMIRTRSLRKRHDRERKQMKHRISSHSTALTANKSSSFATVTEGNERQEESLKTSSKIQKQEARPMGTCVRKCGQCRQLKHVLLAECTVCFRMMDVDLKDCKCQIISSRNIIDHFICSICNSELTLDGYIICANRTCQTTLSTLINKENINEISEKSSLSATLSNICYPKSAYRTVAVQVNTLVNLLPLQRFLSTIVDNENEESSWSKHDLDRTIITSSDSSDTSHLSIDSGVDASLNDIVRNMTAGFNSNQPTKLALQSEDELQQQQQQSQIHNLTKTNNTTVNNSPDFTEMPKSPRCLAIMNARKRHDRLSTLLTPQTNKICQTQLPYLIDIDQMIKGEELSNTTIMRTNNPNTVERQIQVDTIKGRLDDLCQVRLDIADRTEKDSTISVTNDERIVQALTDRDGQRWSELVDQLIKEQSQFSSSDIAQQLLDIIERLNTAKRLNNLTTGQLQRKVRYAMSQFKHIDEHSYLRNNLKTTENIRSETNSRKNTECNGRMDMAVTVRQIDKCYNRQSIVSPDQNWKSYVDRLFEQGHSADEIQRLLREAAQTTMQSDDQRLQDVFNYIKTKTTSSGITFVRTAKKTKPVERQHFQPTNLFQSTKPNEILDSRGGIMTCLSSSISERKIISNISSPALKEKDQGSTIEITKNKSHLPSNNSIKSPVIELDIIQVESSEKTFIIDLHEDEKEQNLSTYLSTNQEHEDIMANPNATTIHKNQSIKKTAIQRERSNGKKSASNNVADTSEQQTNQIQKTIKSKTSQASEPFSFHNLESSSTINIIPSNKSNVISLINVEEKCIHALRSVQNTLDIIDNADIRLHPHPSNIQSELSKLIRAFESYLNKPDNTDRNKIEFLMTECIEHLNSKKKAIVPQLEENQFRNLNEEISRTLNLLQEYKKIIIPVITNNQKSSFHRHISNMIMVQSDAPVSLKRVKENIEQPIESQFQPVQLPFNTNLDSKEQVITLEYQETAGLIRCRPIPYTSSNEKGSTETLKQVLISSTEHISLNSKDPNEQLFTSKSDLNDIPNLSSKTENNLYNDHSQTRWLNSLLSRMSDNVKSSSDIFSASPSLSVIDRTKIDRNDKQNEEQQKIQEPILMETEDRQIPSLYNRSKSSLPIHQPTSNTLYKTDVIILEKEHAIPVIVPDQEVAMLDEQFQVVQTKVSQNKSSISPSPVLNSEDQITPLQDEKNNDNIRSGSVNLDHDSNDTTQKSPSTTTFHAYNLDLEKQSNFSLVNDQSQLITTRSSSHSDVDLSEQSDQFPVQENIIHPEQLVDDADASSSEETFELSQKQVNRENNEKRRPVLEPEYITLSKTDMDMIPETSIKLSSLNEQGKEKRRASISLSPSDENRDQNSIKTSESHTHIEKTPNSSQVGIEALDEYASIATSKLFNHQNNINKLQLPVSTQHLSVSNTLSSNSFLTHLNDQNDTISLEESISSDHLTSDVHSQSLRKTSSINSKDQKVVATSIQNSDDKKLSSGKIDNTVNNKFYTPTMVSPIHSIIQQPPNTILFPSRTFIEKPSESKTPLITATTMEDNDDDKISNESMSNTEVVPIDNMSKDELGNSLNHNNDLLQTEHIDSLVASNASSKESNSFDNTTRIPTSSLKSNESSITDKTDDQQSNKTSVQSIIKEKSSSNENVVAPEYSTTINHKSGENLSVHSSFQFEQSHQDAGHRSKTQNSLKSESLIKQLSSSPNNQSLVDNHSETTDAPNQIRSSYLIEREDKKSSSIEQHHLPVGLNSDTKRVESASPAIINRRPITSTTTVALPSSIASVNTQEQSLRSQISLPNSKNGKSTSDATKKAQRPNSVSSFNLVHRADLTPNNRYEIEAKKLPSQLEKSLTDDNSHHMNWKQQSSSTNSLIRGSTPSSSIPKLLLKRSSIKQTSITTQTIKPNATLSITDVSTSSSNTVAVDHLLSTHSTISNQDEIISLKKAKKRNSSKDGFMVTSDSIPKRNMLRKTSRPSQNQSFIISNQNEKRQIKASKKKFLNNSLLTNSDLAYDTELESEAWIKSHKDINEVLIIDEQDEKEPQADERKQKKINKNRMSDGSQLMPFTLKARSHDQAYTIDSSRFPSIEQSCGEHRMKKLSNDSSRRPVIRLPKTQIEKFECGTIGPRLHPSSIAHQLFSLPSIQDRHEIYQTTESFTDRFYSLMSPENNDDKQAFESILNWQHQHQIPKIKQNKFQYMYLLDTSTGNSVRGKQYPILTDEIDMIDDPNACTIVNKWAFADLVNAERDKFIQEPIDNINKFKKRLKSNPNLKIYLRKRPLTQFEENVFKEVDIISIVDSQTMLLHIPSITVDNQVFIKNRKFKCDQTFDEHCQINTIYHSTLAPLLDTAIDGSKCLCLIGGGKYSGKTYLLRSLIDFFAFDLNRLLSTYDIYIKLLGICHNRVVDLLQNYSPIRIIKSMNGTLIPNDEFHIENDQDIDYITCQIKKRRRFIHQLIQINFRQTNQSTIIGSLMIVVLASSQYIYTRNLCSHRRKFLINSLNKTILSFKRALIGIRQNPDRVRTAFNNDILTRLIQPYVFHDRSNICYIGTLNPGHRHRIATKSTLEFAQNLRFCLKRIKKQRRQRKKFSRTKNNDDELYDNIL